MSNVNTGPKQSPEEAAGLAKEAADKAQRETARDATKETKSHLERLERKEFSGVPSRDLKHDMLDASKLSEKNPDKHYRWLNTRNTDRMPSRVHKEGYQPVPEEEAKEAGVNAQLGNLRLSEQPRKVHERRIAAEQAENQRRLRSHVDEMERVVEEVAKQLRDKHGLDIPPERLLVDE